MPIMPNPEALRTRPPFSTLFTIEPRTLAAITENMASVGYDASKTIDVWREPDGIMTVVDGHTRLKAALANDLGVTYFEHDFADEDEALEYAIHNQRDRRNWSEADFLRTVELLDARKKHGDALRFSDNLNVSPDTMGGPTRNHIADVMGTSPAKVARTQAVIDHAPEPIKEQIAAGEMTINAAYNHVQEQRREQKAAAVAKFNRTNDNIDWAKWSWNPVTGCKHGCTYCYARDIANRFYPQKFEPTFHPERLAAPQNTPVPANDAPGERAVFVCSMADLFGAWVPQEWIDAVLMAVRSAPQWTFLFLTKNPERLVGIDWPDNAWVGTTVDVQARVRPAENAFRQIEATVKFVSLEPFREPITFANPDVFGWYIIGGQSDSTGEPARQPEWDWVEHVLNQARAVNAVVYFKPNLTARPREYP